MAFSRDLLGDGEEVLLDLRPHWASLFGPALLTLLVLAGAVAVATDFPGAPVAVAGVLAGVVAVPALWLLARTWRWLGVRLVLTTVRLVLRRGVLRRDVTQLRLQRIAEIHRVQTLRQRLIGYGRIEVEVYGEAQALVLDDVRRPKAFQRAVNRQLDELIAARAADRVAPAVVAPGGLARRPAATPHPTPPHPTPPHLTPPHGTSPTGAPVDAAVAGNPPADVTLVDAPVVETPVVPAPADVVPVERAPAVTVAERLVQLDELRRRGIVTDEEFQAKKTELLRRL